MAKIILKQLATAYMLHTSKFSQLNPSAIILQDSIQAQAHFQELFGYFDGFVHFKQIRFSLATEINCLLVIIGYFDGFVHFK